MGDTAPRELISLADDEGNSVTVSVLGRDPGWSAGLDAEIVVNSPFVSGRIDLTLYASKLESWANALNLLDAGEDVAWMEMSNGPSVFIQLTGEHDCPEVVVKDESRSMVTVRVPLVPPDDWIADHSTQQRASTGPYGAQRSAGSPIRVWRNAVPAVIAAQRSHRTGSMPAPQVHSAVRKSRSAPLILNLVDAMPVTVIPILPLHGPHHTSKAPFEF
ncbi:DUF5959 family protein [Streptomyces sp. NPDC051098]|uniref:DUF5959 family protein n=1 Tax=Streptomyces sp. NPDC051098 TaxID=3155411 RepID=UPI00341B8E67